MSDFASWADSVRAKVDKALGDAVSGAFDARLRDAMAHAVLTGGKRMRPLLVFAAGRVSGADEKALTAAACAVELIHAYSLVHDDMPAMDNDLLRRGLPTVHAKFGEADALLCGDALQALAFEVLASCPAGAQTVRDQVIVLAKAAGMNGMCGGQAIDLRSNEKAFSREELTAMHRLKTGALIKASVMLGALCGGKPSDAEKQALTDYADALGLAYQIADDVLDATGTAEQIGKTPGKDERDGKSTYVSILGIAEAKAEALKQTEKAKAALAVFGDRAALLKSLADMGTNRKN